MTVRVWVSLVAPVEMPERLTVWRPAFSSMVRLASAASVGGWLTGLTVTVKVRETTLLPVPPSLTVAVIVAVPNAKATGVNLIEPVVLGLGEVTVGVGISHVLLEEAVMVSV